MVLVTKWPSLGVVGGGHDDEGLNGMMFGPACSKTGPSMTMNRPAAEENVQLSMPFDVLNAL